MELCDVLDGLQYDVIQHGKQSLDVQGITIDSRTAKEGYIFVCIKGLNVDGHNYIQDATERGATVIVCEKKDVFFPNDVTVVYVKSARSALNMLAINFYENPAKRMRIIGVTGTNGKTSVTYFLENILRECGYTVGVIGTSGAKAQDQPINIHYATSTTPDTIELHAIFAEMARRGINYVIMEVSSHALAFDKVDGVEFTAGIFTNLTQDHLDFHKTMENYLYAKSKLFDHCKIGIINGDDNATEYLLDYTEDRIPIYTYGIKNGFASTVDFLAENIVFSSEGVSFDVRYNNDTVNFKLSVPGRFSVYNALAVISTAIALKLPMKNIIEGVSKIKSVPGRFQNIPNDRNIRVIVDFAHTPDGIENIISAVREFTEERIITVFGCGGDRDEGKRPKMGKIAGELSDFCVITSDNPRNENPELIMSAIEVGILPTKCDYIKIADRKEAIFRAIEIAKAGDSVIIAGKGDENYQEFENKKRIHFNDAEIAKDAFGC